MFCRTCLDVLPFSNALGICRVSASAGKNHKLIIPDRNQCKLYRRYFKDFS